MPRRRSLVTCRPGLAWPDPDTARRALRSQARTGRARAARTAVEAFDAAGRLRRGYVGHGGDVLTIRLPFLTMSPNRGTWGGAWQTAAAEKRAWIARLEAATRASVPPVRLAAALAGAPLFSTPARMVDWVAPTGPARVTLRRELPSPRHEITDDDNLAQSFKGLIDAVVRAEFLIDDSRRHITRAYVQRVSPDRLPWTEIEIDARPLERPEDRL